MPAIVAAADAEETGGNGINGRMLDGQQVWSREARA